MLEVGSVSKKNMKNILVKNFFDACVGAIMWWATGYALSSGNDTFRTSGNNGFAGTSAFFLDGNVGGTAGLKGGYTKIGWFFSFTFAATACTIVSGAIAERATFMAYALYSVILIGFVYPPIVNMMWVSGKFTAWTSGPRLFGGCGVIDFAGSGAVRCFYIFQGPATSTRHRRDVILRRYGAPDGRRRGAHRAHLHRPPQGLPGQAARGLAGLPVARRLHSVDGEDQRPA